MLTKRQRDLLWFIHGRVKETGVAPSYGEMADAMGMSSKSPIHWMLKSLEERGFIKRLPRRARAIEIIRMPLGRDRSNETRVRAADGNMRSLPHG